MAAFIPPGVFFQTNSRRLRTPATARTRSLRLGIVFAHGGHRRLPAPSRSLEPSQLAQRAVEAALQRRLVPGELRQRLDLSRIADERSGQPGVLATPGGLLDLRQRLQRGVAAPRVLDDQIALLQRRE